jgi:general secretion pathway protein D
MHCSLLSSLRPATALLLVLVLAVPTVPLQAKSRKGDRLLREAQIAESKEDWDKALMLAEQALKTDPSDPAYELEFRRVRFGAGNYHLARGQELRQKGQLAEAAEEFRRAYEIDPSSDIADQELQRTKKMIEREKKLKAADPNAKLTPEQESMTPAQVAKQNVQDRIDSLMPVPVLKPLNPQPIVLRMNNQKPKVLFDTVGKLAGINVLFDPDYDQGGPSRPQSIDLNGTTLNEALDYLALVTHSFWKPLSANTIFVTQENPTKRREYEDEVVKVFYLSNVTSAQELQEVITTLRQVLEVNKLFNYSSQNAVIVRAEPAKMALVEKIIADLDKPKSEVLVDVMVMEVSTQRSNQLAAAFAPTGINSPIVFTPRTSIQTLPGQLGTTSTTSTTGFTNNGTTTTATTGTTTSTTGTTTSTTGTTTTTSAPIPLVNLSHISTSDFSLTNVPGGLLEAIMNDSATRVLQRPQIRAADNFKAVLKIGEKIPTASGSFQPGVGGVGINPLVNTQFTYIDTGVNLEMTPRVHDNGEVSLHIDIDISQVDSYNDLGGIQQPVIGQQKFTADVRMKDGQINLIGGLTQLTDSKTVSGIPGLASVPILKNLFTSNQTTLNKTELLISLVPHIVRGPEITAENLKDVYAGNATNYAVRYSQAVPVITAAAADGAPPAGVPPLTVPAATNPTPLTPEVPVKPAVPAAPGPPARISFSPGRVEAQQGSQFTVSIRADGATNLQSVESQIKFDPKVLKINSITAGDLLQQNGVTLAPQKNILNDSGDASATLARDPAKGSVSGSGALLVVTFQAFGKGQTLVTMPRTMLHDATGAGVTAGSAPLSVIVK